MVLSRFVTIVQRMTRPQVSRGSQSSECPGRKRPADGRSACHGLIAFQHDCRAFVYITMLINLS